MPAASGTLIAAAAPVLEELEPDEPEPEESVSLGRVPLMMRVLVPLTMATRATVELMSEEEPLPTIEARSVSYTHLTLPTKRIV